MGTRRRSPIPIGDVTTYTYDADDRGVGETDPSGGGTTTYTYDPAGNLLTTVTDPDDNTTTYSYDADNRETTQTSPTGGVTTDTYDLVGNLTETVDPDGHTITYSYDADNRETGETWVNPEGGTPLDVFTTTYDADGNVPHRRRQQQLQLHLQRRQPPGIGHRGLHGGAERARGEP